MDGESKNIAGLEKCPLCGGELQLSGCNIPIPAFFSDRGLYAHYYWACLGCRDCSMLFTTTAEATQFAVRLADDLGLISWRIQAEFELLQKRNADMGGQIEQLEKDNNWYRERINELLAQRDNDEWGKSIRLLKEFEEVIGTDNVEEALKRVREWKDTSVRDEEVTHEY